MFRNFKVLLTVLVVVAVAGSAYAFAAGNTVPDSNAGYGDSTVSGYTITDVTYNYVAAAPTTLASIEFTLTSDGADNLQKPEVQISTTAGVAKADFETSTCTVSTTSPWVATCAFGTAINVADVVKLNVLASSSQP
jgi:hypothetical protein